MMTPVHDNLFIGDVDDGMDKEMLEDNEIDTVVNLSGKVCESYRILVEYEYWHVPISDDGDNDAEHLKNIVTIVSNAMSNGNTVLVHCAVGASRSVAVGAKALSQSSERSYEQSLQQIQERRAIANPHPNLREQLQNL